MNSTLINRFPAVGLWFWIAGIAFGVGAGTQDGYLLLGGLVGAALGIWPAVAWEQEREEHEAAARRLGNASVGFLVKDAQWNEERQGFDIHEAEEL